METGITSSSEATRSRWLIPFSATLFGFFVLMMGNLGYTTLIPLMGHAWKANPAQIGLFIGLGGPMLIIMSVPAGEVVKRFGEKTTALALLAVAVGLAVIGASPNFAVGLVGRVIWQIGYVYVFMGLVTASALTSPTSSKSSMMGIMGAVAGLASAIGAPFLAAIAGVWDWRAGFYCAAVVTLVGLLIFQIFYRPGSNARNKQVAEASGTDAPLPGQVTEKPRSAYRSPIAWLLSLNAALGTMGQVATLFFFAEFLESIYHLSTPNVASIISIGSMLSIVLNLVAGFLSDRVGRWSVLGTVLALCGICTFLLTVGMALPVVMVLVVLITALGLCLPNLNNGIAAHITASARSEVGPIMGMIQFISGVGIYVGPQVIGLLVNSTGTFTAGWYFVSAGFAAAFVLVLVLGSFTRRASTEVRI
jgi:predicted MFS family arabinose efflux permease